MFFDPRSTISYVSIYFTLFFNAISEPFPMPILLSTYVGNSLVVNWVCQSSVVTFIDREVFGALLWLHMVDFDVIWVLIG